MTILKTAEGYFPSQDMVPIMHDVEAEVAPMPVMLTVASAYDVFKAALGRVDRGTWFRIDEAGAIWASSKQHGRDYDVVPAETVESLLASLVGTLVGVVAVNDRYDTTGFRIVSIPSDEQAVDATRRHNEANALADWVRLSEPVFSIAWRNGRLERELPLYLADM